MLSPKGQLPDFTKSTETGSEPYQWYYTCSDTTRGPPAQRLGFQHSIERNNKILHTYTRVGRPETITRLQQLLVVIVGDWKLLWKSWIVSRSPINKYHDTRHM